jgi:TRAP transporter TAXI family solute receptor
VATGGTGGVYYVFGGGIAQVISKNIPNVEATAEVTAASVDNCKLIQARKADMALVMADVAYDAFKGTGRFKAAPGEVPVRTLGVLYSNYMHFVAIEGSAIKSMADSGKRVSTGAPGSGTEVKLFSFWSYGSILRKTSSGSV